MKAFALFSMATFISLIMLAQPGGSNSYSKIAGYASVVHPIVVFDWF